MFAKVLFCWSTFLIYRALAQGDCTDMRGRVITNGLHYMPGPETCTLCICDNGQPKHCKAVLCSPPQDCRSFRVGSTCCEFICLDDVVNDDGVDTSMRVTAGAVSAIVLMTALLVVYKVRKQKRRRAPRADDQRSLTSIGYISGSMAYVGSGCESGLPAWKPPSNFLPRGEAPPPYEEAVALSRAETMRISDGQYRGYPEQLARNDEPHVPMGVPPYANVSQCNAHAYANLQQRPVTQMANTQNGYNAPLLQPVLPQPMGESRDAHNPMPPHHLLATHMPVAFPSALRLTGSLGTISNRGLLSLLQREPQPERERPPNGVCIGNTLLHSSLHRTIPRISTAVDTTILDTTLAAGFNRADRSLQGEIRRSFHKPSDTARAYADTGRSMPRNLNLASETTDCNGQGSRRSRAHSDDTATGGIEAKLVVKVPLNNNTKMTAPQAEPPAPATTLPLTVDKPSCECSYDGTHERDATATEDADDYRSECENCKSASSSRWVLEEGWVEEASDGTQTLQRRAPPAAAAPPATATLPQPVTKQNRNIMGPPSNWENWFNTIPDSDSESEEE